MMNVTYDESDPIYLASLNVLSLLTTLLYLNLFRPNSVLYFKILTLFPSILTLLFI